LFPETHARGNITAKQTDGTAIWGNANNVETGNPGDSGSAARFFYCAKASRRDREDGCDHLPARTAGEVTGGREEGSAGLESPRAGAGRGTGSRNHHPTVKPTELMRYLCRLVTPPGGTVLDPFMGSGSTGRGAVLEGFRFIGVEREADYLEIARARIAAVTPEPEEEPEAPAPTGQMTLFT
jgi:site-specific DNA-methyltransferase (adenine-specific)